MCLVPGALSGWPWQAVPLVPALLCLILAACASAGHQYGGGGQYHGKALRRPHRTSQHSHTSNTSLVEQEAGGWEAGGLGEIAEGGGELVVANTSWLRQLSQSYLGDDTRAR